MAGETIEKAKQIVHDIGNSWYFRVWALFWVVSAVIMFASLIVLSREATQAQREQDIAVWFQNASSIQYPRFHFRLDHRGNETFQVDQCSCFFGTNQLSLATCQSHGGFQPAQNQCIAWNSDSFTALNDNSIMDEDSRIYCEILTSGSGMHGNEMMTFELEGEHTFGIGALLSSVFLAPCDNTWIMLQKSVLQSSSSSQQIELWETDLLYHSTLNQTDFYNVTVIMGSYWVRNFNPRDSYNGWMTIGDIGGVGYFMVIIHTLVMIVVGLFLSNTSTFLGGGEHH